MARQLTQRTMFELFVLALLCVGASSAAQSLGPAFAWGDVPLDGQSAGHSTVYQVRHSSSGVPYVQEHVSGKRRRHGNGQHQAADVVGGMCSRWGRAR